MAEAITIARPYAVAVWRHAEAKGEAALWLGMLSFMAKVVTDEAMFRIVTDPRVDEARLSRLMLDICDGFIDETAQNFTRLLIKNGKLFLMPQILAVFTALKSETSGVVDAILLAAFPVNAEFEQAIAAKMQRKLNREIRFRTVEDKTLLGGVIIRIGDMVVDASVRGQVESLAAQLRL